jgi:hypothetical protein
MTQLDYYIPISMTKRTVKIRENQTIKEQQTLEIHNHQVEIHCNLIHPHVGQAEIGDSRDELTHFSSKALQSFVGCSIPFACDRFESDHLIGITSETALVVNGS